MNPPRIKAIVAVVDGIVFASMFLGLIAAAAISLILLSGDITLTSAQEQNQLTNQSVSNQNATLFQSTEDGFRVQVPEGWVIQDVNNTGSALLEESTQGYGILAQLCPEGQQQAALSNVSGSNTASCQGSEGDIIHIIRYPDLDTRSQVPNNVTTNNNMRTDNILLYHLQKLQEVGYRAIQIANSTETTVNLTISQTNQTIERIPGRLVEMTYSTNFAPNETRRSYFILTASDATAPNLGTTKGYTILYEGSRVAEEETTTASDSLLPPIPVRQVFDSFELIAAPELAQAIAQEAQAAETAEDGGDGGDGDEGNSDNGGDERERDEGDGGDSDEGNESDGGEDDDGGDDDRDEEGGPTMAERITKEGKEMAERIIEDIGVLN